MLDAMSAEQFTYWLAYSRLRPFGHTNRLLAEIEALLYNVHRGEHDDAITGTDILPVSEPDEDDEQSERQRAMEAALEKKR